MKEKHEKIGEGLCISLKTKVGMGIAERECCAVIPNNRIYKDNLFVSSSSLLPYYLNIKERKLC